MLSEAGQFGSDSRSLDTIELVLTRICKADLCHCIPSRGTRVQLRSAKKRQLRKGHAWWRE
ncbi:hypothetical protein BDP55DRAFT_639710 [Colletotrichum godetiae]|uniref:Uncharacterized protein n=1 Tax=Colletotrichum godetiae TaxID=1209918 RepID=A0AAJ0EZ39_9PEZI|nr:uncharacterized protein BDP55DRAFT_639710 [Colletotrichum godetiae]KAK1700844.1 hypothetical protein BDP55DRAFT_639710 [Colletotrichum godetiae]